MTHKFKKKYGQNFLNDLNIINKIINSVYLSKDDIVIEIGAGSGNLTKELEKKVKKVIAYEIDSDLEEQLRKKLNNTDIIIDDFLKRDIKKDIKESYNNLYIIANLPYYITTPIIKKIIDDKIDPTAMILMVQKEVGERFMAIPNTRQYGSLTVYLNYYFDIKKLMIVPKDAFYPKPKINSMVVMFTKKEIPYQVKNEELFFKLVRDAFTYKRKNLKNNLKDYNLNIIQEVLQKHNLDLTARAEQIPIELFISIADKLSLWEFFKWVHIIP